MQETPDICDCERSHNGIGAAGRPCDCQAGAQTDTEIVMCGCRSERDCAWPAHPPHCVMRWRGALVKIEAEAKRCRTIQGAAMPKPGDPAASYGYGMIGLVARAALTNKGE